ncbi:MAG: hypothetical protein RL215_2310, partial [Planctomycetota bacterium]
TNTPLQALAALNDEQLVEAARVLAEKALQESSGNDAACLRQVCRLVLSRAPSNRELEILTNSLTELRDWYSAHESDAAALIAVGETQPSAAIPAAELAAWTMLCNQLLNLDEVLNK